MISAFAEASKVLGDDAYRDAAERARRVRRRAALSRRPAAPHVDGRTRRSSTPISTTTPFWSTPLLDLYEATADPSPRDARRRARPTPSSSASRIASDGGFFFTGTTTRRWCTVRSRSFDGSIPSGNSAAVEGLLRLFHYLGDERFLDGRRARACAVFAAGMAKNPFGFAHMIGVADFYLRKPREIVIVGRSRRSGDAPTCAPPPRRVRARTRPSS